MGKDLIFYFVKSSGIDVVSCEQFICACCASLSHEKPVKNEDLSLCLACSFLNEPNANLFGFLTKNRAHSPCSFINSLLVFYKGGGLTLVTTANYAKNIPSSENLDVVVSSVDDFIIEYLKNPVECLIVRTGLKIQPYINNMLISDAKKINIIGSSGNVGFCVSSWCDLLKIIENTPKDLLLQSLNIFDGITRGDGILDVLFVKENYVLFTRLSSLLDVLPHSRIYLLKLMRSAINNVK